MLQHQHAVRYAKRQCPSAAAFPDDHAHDRDLQPRHDAQVARDRFCLPALLGSDTRIGARCIDKRDDRTTELFRQLHQAERLPVAFGVRHPKVPLHPLFERFPLLMPDNHDRATVEAGEAAKHRLIIPEDTVAVQLDEVVAHGV